MLNGWRMLCTEFVTVRQQRRECQQRQPHSTAEERSREANQTAARSPVRAGWETEIPNPTPRQDEGRNQHDCCDNFPFHNFIVRVVAELRLLRRFPRVLHLQTVSTEPRKILNARFRFIGPFELDCVLAQLAGLPGTDVPNFAVVVVVPALAGNRIGDRFAQFMRGR